MSTKKFNANNYGSIDDILEVAELTKSSKTISVRDLKNYFSRKSVGLAYSITGIVELLYSIDWLEAIGGENYKINHKHFPKVIKQSNLEEIKVMLMQNIFYALKYENLLTDYIDLDSLDFDISSGETLLLADSIPLRYSGLRKLMKSLGFFVDIKNRPIYYQIGEEHQEFFHDHVLEWIHKSSSYSIDTGLTYEEFKRIQKIKEELGDWAEEQIVLYEIKRLEGHPQLDRIKKISKIKVNAGYDIISFEGIDSFDIDRFIEVKSYSGKLEFYWSKNEITVANRKKNHYFLYLVDRDNTISKKHNPIIIQNPYDSVHENEEWKKDPTVWKVTEV
jgi:hypothetical protein